MKSLVVYKSISGFTKRYAEWISQELHADCIGIHEIDTVSLHEYDLVIFGGSLHAVGINGYKKFRMYIGRIGNQKIIIFAVGASPVRAGIEAEVKAANLVTDEEQAIPLFYFRGGFDYSKLDFPNKVLMRLLEWKLRMKKNRTADEKGMLGAYSRPLDAAKQKNIEPLLDYIKAAYQNA